LSLRPPGLGVGLSYQGSLRGFVREHLEAFDFLEIIPDIFWTEVRGPDGALRFEENREGVRLLDWLAGRRPLVAHAVGMSLGSAEGGFTPAYLEQLSRWQQRYRFAWLSEHLSFMRLPHASGEHLDLGMMLPVPYDEETLELLAGRVSEARRVLGAPFLVENNVFYHQLPEQELGEPAFLSRLAQRTDCGLLLDLHNLHTNARNHGFSPREFLDGLDLSRVVELHIAGGYEWEGFYVDAHSGACPEEVWALLEEVLPRLPNLGGVVYEMFGNYLPLVGAEVLLKELRRLREVLERHGRRP
jgi:hypothetical protein